MSYRSRAVSPPKTRFLLNEGCIGYANDFDCTPVPYTSAVQPIAKVEGVVKHHVSSNRDLQNMNLGSCYQSKMIPDGRPFLDALHEDGESPMMNYNMTNQGARSKYKYQINLYLYNLEGGKRDANTGHVHDVFRYIDSSLIPCKNTTDHDFLFAYSKALETRKLATQALLYEWEQCIIAGRDGTLSPTAMSLWTAAVDAYRKLETYGPKKEYHSYIDNTRRNEQAATEEYKKYLYKQLHGRNLGTEESNEDREFNVFSSLNWLHSMDKGGTHKGMIDEAQEAMNQAKKSIVSDFQQSKSLSDASKELLRTAKERYEAILKGMEKERYYSRIRLSKNSLMTVMYEINMLIRIRESKLTTMQSITEDKMYDVFRGVSKNAKARLTQDSVGAARLEKTMQVVSDARNLLIKTYQEGDGVSDDSYQAYSKARESYNALMAYDEELRRPPAKKPTQSRGAIKGGSMLKRSAVSLGSQQVCVCAHPIVCNLPIGSRPVRTF